MPYQAVILDIDGTLIDSNDQHAHAWVDAGQALGHPFDYQTVRCMIGMGGDQIIPKLTGSSKDSPLGKELAHLQGEIFKQRYLASVKPFPRVRELLQEMRAAHLKLVIGSSAKKDQLDNLLAIAQASDLIDAAVCSADVDQSKPNPDIIEQSVARAQVSADQAIMIGDTPYDLEAARRAGVASIAFLCGGWRARAMGLALAIYQDPADLLTHFNQSPLAPGHEASTAG